MLKSSNLDHSLPSEFQIPMHLECHPESLLEHRRKLESLREREITGAASFYSRLSILKEKGRGGGRRPARLPATLGNLPGQ